MNKIHTTTLKTRIPLFWLVCAIGMFGPVACIYNAEQQPGEMSRIPTAPKGKLCNVESVYDGDTAWVVCNGQREKLRLYCIDAPEMGQKPWGRASRDHLRSIIGETVNVESIDTDRYGRTVARLWSGSLDLNGQMISDGWAAVYPKYCPRSEVNYYDVEQRARNDRRAVWVDDGLQGRPWVWRRH